MRRQVCFLVGAGLAFVLCLSVPSAAAPPAAEAGAGKLWETFKWDGPKDEHWLAVILEDELRRSRGAEEREKLAARLGGIALARLGCDRLETFQAPAEIVHAIRACVYLAKLEAEGDEGARELADWLLEHREVRRLLFRALGDVKETKQALDDFRQLQASEAQRVLEYPNLAVAFATSRPLRHYKDQPDAATLLEALIYYTDAKKQFQYALKKMPYELSRYLADTRLNVAEREWAYKRYARTRTPGAAYFHVKYDHEYYAENKPKKISELDYTLANLAKVGGVCIDQAYYATEVCKAIGIPATIVHGKGSSGIGHSWFTYFQMNPAGTSAGWEGGAGRYASHDYFVGTLREPASGKTILDTELVLVGSAALLPLQRREEAEAATTLARLAAEACKDGNIPADPAPLKDLAEQYEQRFAKQPGAPRLVTTWIEPKRAVEMPLVEDLLYLAIRRNLAYPPAWQLVVSLRKDDRIPVKSLDQFLSVLIEKTAQAFPEHSCFMVLEMVPTLSDVNQRDKAYKRSLAVYGRRPDLKGKILLALGDEYRQRGENKQAITVYQAAASECINVPDVVMTAAGRAEDLLLADKRNLAAMKLYQMLFSRTRKQDCAEEIRKSTSHYKLGKRLAELLQDAGKHAIAEKILAGL